MALKRTAGGALALFVMCGLGMWVYTREVSSDNVVKDSAIASSEFVRPVQVAKVERLDGGTAVRLSGVTRPSSQSRVSFSVGGRISKRPVEVGDRLKKGDVIAVLDPEALRHAVQAGEASIHELNIRLKQADKDSNRMESLARQGGHAIDRHGI